MKQFIELLGFIFLTVFNATDHIPETGEPLCISSGDGERIIYNVDKSQFLKLTDLQSGANYILHVTSLGKGTHWVRHSGIGVLPGLNPCEHQSELPMSLEFTARGKRAFTQLKLRKNGRLSISLLERINQSFHRTQAGIEIDDSYTTEELVNEVLLGGNCFDVNDIEGIGAAGARAFFKNGTEALGFEQGIVFSTGEAADAVGPNNSTNTTTAWQYSGPGDPDLSEIIGVEMHDVAGIEFDFIPTVEQVTFRYVFASEEYCEYVNSQFNDVFGFFLSCPGINGPFTNGGINLATLPTSGDFVSINNVNYSTNKPYYINNAIPNSGGGIGGCVPGEESQGGEVLDLIEYDGLTVPLEAVVQVQPCEEYHIKLVVGDATDGIFDSAVFLEENSFLAGGKASFKAVNTVTHEPFTCENGCYPSRLIVDRQGGGVPPDQPLTVDLLIDPSGSATEGVDFDSLPDQITIPANRDSIIIPIQMINDTLSEGNETIVMKFDFICECKSPKTTFTIKELNALQASLKDTTICEGQSAPLICEAVGGQEQFGYSYLWNTGEEGVDIQISPEDTTDYSVTVTDSCGTIAVAGATVHVVPLPQAEIVPPDTLSCQDTIVALQALLTGGHSYVIQWSTEDGHILAGSDSFQALVDEQGTYTLQLIDEVSQCSSFYTLEVEAERDIPKAFFGMNREAYTYSFIDSSTGSPDKWHWDFGDGSTSEERHPTHVYMNLGTYKVCLTVSNDCGERTECKEITVSLVETEKHQSEEKPCICPGDGNGRLQLEKICDPFKGMKLYPNPATSHLSISVEWDRMRSLRIRIIDRFGRTHQRMQYSTTRIDKRIDLRELPEGLYFIAIETGDGTGFRKILIDRGR